MLFIWNLKYKKMPFIKCSLIFALIRDDDETNKNERGLISVYIKLKFINYAIFFIISSL
jgi:hypothetical protein